MTHDFPPSFWVGIDQFNQRQFYACHDTLEELWMDALAPERIFYQGILQIAVALYHLGNRNWQGTVTLLGEGIQRLSSFQPNYGEINVAELVHNSNSLLRTLQEAGPESVDAIAQQIEQTETLHPGTLSYPIINNIAS